MIKIKNKNQIQKESPTLECEARLPSFCDEIIELIRSGLPPKRLVERLNAYHEKDIAEALSGLTRDERYKLFCLLRPEELAAVLECSECGTDCLKLLELLGLRRTVEVISHMETTAAAELIGQMPREQRAAVTELLDGETLSELKLLSSFDEDELGSRMSTNYIAIPDSATIKEAMSELIRQAAENDNISMLYLVDEKGIFCGAVELKELIIARSNFRLADITKASYPYLYASSRVEDCIAFITDYAEASIPVLDRENRLLGVVTASDFIEILDDELGDDYAKLAGLSSEEDLNEPILQSAKKRIPWLVILLLLGFGVSSVVGSFEAVISRLPIIMCFQSLILDMAGNVGTQSLAVAIRVLTDAQIARRQKLRLVLKEARIGLLNGVALGMLSSLFVFGYILLLGNPASFALAVAGCLGTAMLLAMVISALSGTLIPLMFKRLGIDPAVASGPLITTVNDLVAVIAYYGLSWLVLINMLRL